MPDQLPEPLTPAGCDLRDFQYMELDVSRLRDSKFAATPRAEAFRAGVLLWCAAWHQVPAASLPDDDVELANLAGYGRMPVSVKEWRKVRAEALNGFVKCTDGRLYHAVIAEKAIAAHKAKEKHAYDRFLDRLRKENRAREKESKPLYGIPTQAQWKSGAYPHGIPPPEPTIPPERATGSTGIPAENALRGNGEGTERNGTETLISVPDGTGDMVAKRPVDLDARELWWAAKTELHSQGMDKPQCGKFVGKLAKDFTEPIALEAIRSSLMAPRANFAEYLKSCCMHAAGQRHQPNAQERLEAGNRAVVARMLEREGADATQ